MARIAIHPQTLDIREFKPGMGYQSKGYLVFKNSEELYQNGRGLIGKLFVKVGAHEKKKGYGPADCVKIWPDLMLRAINNIAAIVETDAAGNKESEFPTPEVVIPPDVSMKLGRGNHNVRVPNVRLTGKLPAHRVPMQAAILAVEFKKLYEAGIREVDQGNQMTNIVEAMNLATKQLPIRIYRYYFWLLVRVGVLETLDGSFEADQVVRQISNRFGYSPNLPEKEVVTG